MDKHTFISEISKPLKLLGYRKNKNYWHKTYNDLIFCINVQGSQWDKNDYYIQIGVSLCNNGISNPSLLQWYFRHRCCGANGEKNILPDEFLSCVSKIFSGIHTVEDVENLLKEHHATKVVSQYWF